MFNHDRFQFGLSIVAGDGQANHPTPTVQLPLLIEDEVTDAVIDRLAFILLGSLQRMGMVAYQTVGTGIDELPRLLTLLRHHLSMVLPAPVQADNDIAGRVVMLQTTDTQAKRVHALLTDAGLLGQVGIVFQ